MSRTYKATGINLKSMPMGETDRLLTVLTREFGLLRIIAMGSRKHNSSLAGRSSLFVVNNLLIAKGRSLDKLTQAETLESYPGLSQDLKKLTASQYLAELCLYQALSDQPQEELFCLLSEHLKRLERAPLSLVLPHLTHAIFQLLILAGIAPQVHLCCVTRQPLTPDIADSSWRIGFSIPSGGTVTLEALEKLKAEKKPKPVQKSSGLPGSGSTYTANMGTSVPQTHMRVAEGQPAKPFLGTSAERTTHHSSPVLHIQITAAELALLQQLAQAELPKTASLESTSTEFAKSEGVWQLIERVLRYYAQYHFDRPIRSATLVDACFASTEYSLTS